jgi:hypothetical protein
MLDDIESRFIVNQVCSKYDIKSTQSTKNIAGTLQMFSDMNFFGLVESGVEFMLFDQSIRFLFSVRDIQMQITEHNIIPYLIASIVITNKFYADYRHDIYVSNKKLAEILDVEVKYINEYELKCLCFTQSSLSSPKTNTIGNDIYERDTTDNSDSASTTTTKTFDSDQTIPMYSKRAKIYIEELKMFESSSETTKATKVQRRKKRQTSNKPFSLFI